MLRVVLFGGLVLAACQRDPRLPSDPSPSAPSPSAPAPAPGARAMTPPPSTAPAHANDGGGLAGEVAETIDAAGYTYVRILTADGSSTWLAGPPATLPRGTQLAGLHGMEMQSFRSNTLNRTFDSIYFIDKWPATVAAGAPAHAQPAETPPPAEPPAELSGKIVETMDAGGYTYAKLDRAGTQLWIAGPQTKVAVGAQLGTMRGTLMPNFRSNTLNRTFDQIYFVDHFALP